MKLSILATDDQKKEWLSKSPSDKVELYWANSFDDLQIAEADAYFDLRFEIGSGNIEGLIHLNAPIFINDVIHTIPELFQSFDLSKKYSLFRINAWPTFLKREITEIASISKEDASRVSGIFSALGWKFKWVPDIPGLISARVIAMVINEAYYTLQADVSTKDEIDIAMKLGTNYPYGPFEWSELIGLQNIYRLLIEMSRTDEKYQPAELLKKETEALSAWH